jgi:hypothetical protein
MTPKQYHVCPHCMERVSKSELILMDESYIPTGCICDIDDWFDPDNIPEICSNFEEYNNVEITICKHCQHCLECHMNKEKVF